MTRLLIVDDDPNQCGLLARVISARAQEVSVSTAEGGDAAINMLRDAKFDVVLTDLQMPGTNGFALVEWLRQYQPHIQVFTMTAYPDDVAVRKLKEAGSVECYTKPLDVGALVQRVEQARESGMRGRVCNIGLTSLLQLIEMERKTCTLTVESRHRVGHVYLSEGQLIDARTGSTRGETAAIEIASWRSAEITIVNNCVSLDRTVFQPLGFILMEAMRVADETLESGQHRIDVGGQVAPDIAEASAPDALDADSVVEDPFELDAAGDENESTLEADIAVAQDAFALDTDGNVATDMDGTQHDTLNTDGMMLGTQPTLSAFPSSMPRDADALAVAIIDAQTGKVRSHAGALEDLPALATLMASVYSAETRVAERLDDAVDELVLTSQRFWSVSRPLPNAPDSLALLVFDPQDANVVMQRLALQAFVAAFDDWRRAHG